MCVVRCSLLFCLCVCVLCYKMMDCIVACAFACILLKLHCSWSENFVIAYGIYIRRFHCVHLLVWISREQSNSQPIPIRMKWISEAESLTWHNPIHIEIRFVHLIDESTGHFSVLNHNLMRPIFQLIDNTQTCINSVFEKCVYFVVSLVYCNRIVNDSMTVNWPFWLPFTVHNKAKNPANDSVQSHWIWQPQMDPCSISLKCTISL